MYSSQSNTNQSNTSENKSLIEVSCVLLDQNKPTNIELTATIEAKTYYPPGIERAILAELKKTYPGVESINIYVSKRKLQLLSNNNDNLDDFIEFPENLLLTKEISEQLEPLYFKITRIYGLRKFTTISEVECNYENFDGTLSSENILLPDVAIPLNKFKEVFKNYVKLNNEIEDEFEINVKNEKNDEKPVNTISEENLKEIIITLTHRFKTFDELINSIPAYNHKCNDEAQLKELLHDFYNPEISFHTYIYQKKRLLIGFPSHAKNLQKSFLTISDLLNTSSKSPKGNEQYSHIFGLIGPSGCGKTTTLYELGKKYPLIYVNANVQDIYRMLIESSINVQNEILGSNDYSSLLQQNEDFLNKLYVVFSRFFYAVYIYYYKRHFIDKISNTDLINEQFNGASVIIKNIWDNLQDKTNYTDSFLDLLKKNPDESFNIAFDEAQLLCKHCTFLYSNSYAATSNLGKESSHQSLSQRHIYYALTCYFIRFGINTFFAGTSFLLKQCTEFTSLIGKVNSDFFSIITDFGLCKNPLKVLKQCLKIDDIVISDEIQKMIEKRKGNWRYTFSILNNIMDYYNNEKSQSNLKLKSEVFNEAVVLSDKGIRSLLSKNSGNVKIIIDRFKNDTKFLLGIAKSQLFANLSMDEIEMTFNPKEIDLCCDYFHINNVHSTQNDDEYKGNFFIYEPLIKEVLDFTNKTFSECLQRECINTSPVFNADGSTQGKIFELLCLYQLCHFNGILVSDLPFVKNIKNLPHWAKNTKLLANCFGTGWEYYKFKDINKLQSCSAESNCYPDCNGNFYEDNEENIATESDARFISQSKDFVGRVLKPQYLTRPDGFLPMLSTDNNEIHPLLLGIKCYSSPLASETIQDNTNSTDPKLLFATKDKKKTNQTKRARQILSENQTSFQGSLRIHILISPNEINEISQVTPQGDILIYITKNNLKDYFDFEKQDYLEKYFNTMILNRFKPSKKRKSSEESGQENPPKRQKTTKPQPKNSVLRRSPRFQKNK